jgi:uncharacterized protein (TIGR03437 family)
VFFRTRSSTLALLALGTSAFLHAQILGDAPLAPAMRPLHGKTLREDLVTIRPRLSAAWLDISNRATVQNSWNQTFVPTTTVPTGWTGDVVANLPGTTSQAFKDAVAARVNWFRAMAGVPPQIALSSIYGAKDQQAALMFSANRQISHTPPVTWIDYTAEAAEAASNSNICYGYSNDPGCVMAYLIDTGSNNTVVGHRRWILYPQTMTMGTGDVPQSGPLFNFYPPANALWVFDGLYGTARPASRTAFVAWPPAGYVPYQVVGQRWSFSYPGADFTHAAVSMVRNGAPVPVRLEQVANGYGENTLVWVPDNLDTSVNSYQPPAPPADTTSTVTVSNVLVNGAPQTFSYAVTVFDPATNSAVTPVLSIATTHAGSFTAGQIGTYSVTVSNHGAGQTSGTVSVTETVPAGLTLASMAGTGWTCPSGAASCTRSDALNAGGSYSPITVTVNVAANAPSQVTNQVSVSGGGSASASASDVTNIGPACTGTTSPSSIAVAGTSGSLNLNLNGGACAWTATSNVAWLTPGANSGFGGTLSVNVSANASGVQRSGSLTVSGQTLTVTQPANNANGPSLVSLSPFQGSGLTANLTLGYADPNGWAAIQSAEFIVNPRWESNGRAGGCYVKYAPGTGLFTLIADDGAGIAGTAAPGSSGTIANSQCTLHAVNSSVNASGNNLTLVAALTFQPTFTGQRHIWMQAVDYANQSTNWLVYGVWYPTQTSVTAGPWYRIYDPFSKSYLYSADQNEYNYLASQGFQQQGSAGLVMSGPGTVGGLSNIAWYRVFVSATGSHFWTSDRNEFLSLINQQQAYVGEGVAAFVMPYLNPQGQISPPVTNTIPFYRAAFQGANLHFWTSDPNEYFGAGGKHLPTGYSGEGIACYIFPTTGPQFTGVTDTPAEQVDDGAPAVLSIVNSASRAASGAISPGQAITLLGRHLGGAVRLNGAPAQVISATNTELRIIAPQDFNGATEVSLELEHRGRRTRPVKLSVVPADPALFGTNAWGRGNVQARNQDGTEISPDHAAPRGSVVTLYAAAIGNLPLEVHIGGQPAEVLATRPSATRAGVVEVQVRIPTTIDSAAFQPVVIHAGNLFSQPGVGLAVQ